MKKKILFILIIIMLGLGIYLEVNQSKNAFKEYSSKTLEYVYLNGIYDEKYKDEYEWGGVFAMNPGVKTLSDEEYQDMVEKYRSVLCK